MLVVPFMSSATHLKGGYIRIDQSAEASLRYRISLHIFSSLGGVLPGSATSVLDFGDGQSITVPAQVPTPIDNNTGLVVYTVEHTYAVFGAYIISYTEPNRNQGLLNLVGSINIPFYIESFVLADGSTSNFASPELLTIPILTAPLRREYNYGITAVDRSGNLVVYRVEVPEIKGASLANRYSLPENFKVNPFNGMVSWDTKYKNGYSAGEYLFNVRIFQFKDNILQGYMTLEFTVILRDEPEELLLTHGLSLDGKNRIFIEKEDQKSFKVLFRSNTPTTLALDPYTDLNPLHFTFNVYDSTVYSDYVKVGLLKIRNEVEMVRDHPYIVTIRGTSASEHNFKKDVTFMIFSKDTDITEIPTIREPDDHEEEKQFRLYPNPARSTIQIDWPSDGFAEIVFYNMAGQLVFHGNVASGTRIRLDFLSQGMYLYKVTDGTLSERGKLLKL